MPGGGELDDEDHAPTYRRGGGGGSSRRGPPARRLDYLDNDRVGHRGRQRRDEHDGSEEDQHWWGRDRDSENEDPRGPYVGEKERRRGSDHGDWADYGGEAPYEPGPSRRAESKAADEEDDEDDRGGGWGDAAASEDEGFAPHGRGSSHRAEAPARRAEPAEEKPARDAPEKKAQASTGGTTSDQADFVDFETAPAGGPGQPMMTCLVVRDRSGLKYMAPEYMLYLQNGRKRGHEKLILIARRHQNPSGGCSYHIYNVSRGHVGGRLKKKGGNYIGKLKASYNKSENVMYNNEQMKEELGGIWFDKPKLLDHMRDGPQPRKLRIILPPMKKGGTPKPHKVPPSDYPFGGLLGQLQSENVDSDCFLLEGKEPVYENRHYRLNFHGRVTVPSVKNFQLVDPADIDEVICQFGKVDDDRFHLDFKGPLNAFQAFCVALSQFNY